MAPAAKPLQEVGDRSEERMLTRHILTQGTAIRSLMRNLGGSLGISILVATLAQNSQVVHSRLVEGLRPDNPLAQAPFLAAPFSLITPSGDGGADGGVMLLAQAERRLGIAERLAQVIPDRRDQDRARCA
jgi:hypothetical protein